VTSPATAAQGSVRTLTEFESGELPAEACAVRPLGAAGRVSGGGGAVVGVALAGFDGCEVPLGPMARTV
jgi:hypothetical protein